MKRAGERGEGKWTRISWDEAFDTIEQKLKEIRDQYGAESVLFCQGTGRDIGGPISFLAYAYGSPNWVQLGLAGQSCYTPRLAAMFATMGDYAVLDAGQFDAKRYDAPEWTPPKCIIVWANNPVPTCPDASAQTVPNPSPGLAWSPLAHPALIPTPIPSFPRGAESLEFTHEC
jgi:anaerobic selenocysteine-containing dehydrogenase